MKVPLTQGVGESTVQDRMDDGSTRVVSWKSAETATSTSSTDVADAEFELHRRAEDRAWAVHERQRMDEQVAELAAELEAKAAREAKRNRPIRIRSFPIE